MAKPPLSVTSAIPTMPSAISMRPAMLANRPMDVLDHLGLALGAGLGAGYGLRVRRRRDSGAGGRSARDDAPLSPDGGARGPPDRGAAAAHRRGSRGSPQGD